MIPTPDGYRESAVDAEDGGKKAISAKDKQRIAVSKSYTLLGHYAEMACNDDLATFNTSGFTQVAAKVKTALRYGRGSGDEPEFHAGGSKSKDCSAAVD